MAARCHSQVFPASLHMIDRGKVCAVFLITHHPLFFTDPMWYIFAAICYYFHKCEGTFVLIESVFILSTYHPSPMPYLPLIFIEHRRFPSKAPTHPRPLNRTQSNLSSSNWNTVKMLYNRKTCHFHMTFSHVRERVWNCVFLHSHAFVISLICLKIIFLGIFPYFLCQK